MKSQLTQLEQEHTRWRKRSTQQVSELNEATLTPEQSQKHLTDVAKNRSDQRKIFTDALVYRLEGILYVDTKFASFQLWYLNAFCYLWEKSLFCLPVCFSTKLGLILTPEISEGSKTIFYKAKNSAENKFCNSSYFNWVPVIMLSVCISSK